jgi:hypothetical protein
MLLRGSSSLPSIGKAAGSGCQTMVPHRCHPMVPCACSERATPVQELPEQTYAPNPSMDGARLRQLAPSEIAPCNFVEPPTATLPARFGCSDHVVAVDKQKGPPKIGWPFLLARPEGFEPPTTWFEDATSQIARVSPIREARVLNNLIAGRPLQDRPRPELVRSMSRKSHATTWLSLRAAKLAGASDGFGS